MFDLEDLGASKLPSSRAHFLWRDIDYRETETSWLSRLGTNLSQIVLCTYMNTEVVPYRLGTNFRDHRVCETIE